MIVDILRLMSVLILKNVKTEGTGTIEDFLREANIHYKIVELETETISEANNFDTLVMMGGPMSVNEAEIYPYIKQEEALAKDFIDRRKKVLGICLGAQIMAKALGANVYRGKEPEIGWYNIELTESGIKDNIMKKLALHPKAGDFWKKFSVFHWHGETFDMPEGAVRLAKSDLYPNQAFKYNDNAYAFQFHIEVTKEMVYDWLKNEPVDLNKIKAETEKFYEIYHGRAGNFYKAFFE
jgi:GMP synthase-like glutamine amidotransferase